jgi:serine/threonine protein kinase/Flp pilus assembly protein TadD
MEEAPLVPSVISHYKILEKLGEGGMGVVYKAHDTKLKRIVALKFLPTNLIPSADELKRFQQEAEAISALNHPHIATIYDFDEADGQKFLALEFIPGGTLGTKLRDLRTNNKQLPIEEVITFGIQVAEALAHAHRHAIIHRDVKSHNVMITEDGSVKVTDFGLARLGGSQHLTRTGNTVGTTGYMSPEQLRGEEVDQRSDLFSLGVLLYELATNQLPFQAEHEPAVAYSIVNENPPPVRSRRADAPEKLEHIIARCLEKDPGKRYQRAEEVAADLRSLQRGETPLRTAGPRPSRLPWMIAAVLLLIVAALLYLFMSPSRSISANSKTIAVLPFVNMSGDPQDEYFSDGIMEDILTQLSKIADLNVISRTTMTQYKGTKKPLKEIGRELNAGVVLEGSVRHSGNRIRIASQLIDAETDRHVWAESYDREMQDVFAIQSDVAQEIASSLQARLSPAEKERIEKKQTDNTEAYQFYLKGRYYWNKRRTDDIKTAIGYFNQAIEKDPNYALAHAGLASAIVIQNEYSRLQPNDILPNAKAAATRALELDPTLGEPHAVLGFIESTFEYDWSGAENEFKRAIELSPSNLTAHQWYGNYFRTLGKFDRAREEIHRAEELDPLSLTVNVNVAITSYYMREYDKAIEQLKKTIAFDPSFPPAHEVLGYAYAVNEKLTDAIAEFQNVRSLVGNSQVGLSGLGYAYARAGMKHEALKVLNELLRRSNEGYALSGDVAIVYCGLGDREKTFEWLEKAYQERNFLLTRVKVSPLWDDLRSDPRFIALLKKIRLEE